MKALITFAVDKAITIFMVVLAIIIFGVVSFTRLTTDLFPDINIPVAIVMTSYPGATPDEVEQEVSIPLERTFQTTSNIQEVQTTSSENFSLIFLEFSQNTNMDSAIIEMREQLNNMISQLPDDASNPSILRLNPDMLPIMNFSVSYEGKDIEELTNWVDDVLSPRIERVSGVAQLNVSGGFESEIRVMLDQSEIDSVNAEFEAMMEFVPEEDQPDDMDVEELINKSFVSNILQAQNFAFPAGFITIDDGDYMVRVGDELSSLEEIETLKLIDMDFGPMGEFVVHLDDIATVEFVDQNDQTYSKVNGQDSLSLSVQKGSEFATTDVTGDINQVLQAMSEEHEGFEYTMLLDQGEYIEQATGSVLDNLLLGAVLAIAVLFLFLRNVRVTLVIGVAIPISLMFAIILIYLSGISLNVVSLGGLALGIGMLVDNSIVVIENIFRMKKEGRPTREAAIRGTHQVGGAIIASTLTTIGVFLPIMFIEDFIREIFFQLALTITFSLLASLLIALTFVPTVANRVLNGEINERKSDKVPFFEKVKGLYTTILSALFKVKSIVMAIVLILFVGVFFLATSRGFEFFPETDEGSLQATLEVAPGENLTFEQLSDKLDAISDDILALDEVETIGISLGGDPMQMLFMGGSNDNQATANIVLSSDRTRSTVEMANVVTDLIESNYPEFLVNVQGTESDTDAIIGSGIQVRISGDDLDILREEALSITALLEDVDGISEVDSGLGQETEEVRISVDKDAAIESGLTNAQIMGVVSEYLSEPSVVTSVRLNGNSYDLYVYDEDETSRRVVADIDELRQLIVGSDFEGNPILLESVADVDYAPGFASITRVNGARSLTVDASIASGRNASLVAEDVESALADYELPTGYTMTVLGESEEIQSSIETMLLVGALGILLVYMIMASQFQSFSYPFIIMITIPLAFTGGFGALYLSGDAVSIVALIGLVILSGVVVNNGIVLVDYINQMRSRGRNLTDAIFEAGSIRIRPIFMTALTTILALSGAAFAAGEGAELIQPLALTAIGGLIYATFLTIFVVPIMYYGMTLYGRYIVGSLVTLGFLLATYLLFSEAMYLYMSATLVTVVGIIAWMVLTPNKALIAYKASERNESDDS